MAFKYKDALFLSQEEEDGSDEDCVSSLAVDELPVPPPRRPAQPAAGEEDSDRDSDPAFVSPLDEVKAVRQQDALTTANLHEASRWVKSDVRRGFEASVTRAGATDASDASQRI